METVVDLQVYSDRFSKPGGAMTKAILGTLCSLILLTACGPIVSDLGPNTYLASGGSVYGNTSSASETCQRQGKRVKVNDIGAGPDGRVIFTCLSPGHPDYDKPVRYDRAPNVIIQDNRR